MDFVIFFITLLSIMIILLLCIYFNHRRRPASRLPPGPYPFPVIGNILSLGSNPHHSLTSLSKIHGPVMSLKLGNLTTIVVSTPETAQKILHKNDRICSGRHVPDISRILDHNKYSVVFISATTQWRTLRKISKEHIFSQPQMDAKQGMRLKKVEELVAFVRRSSVVKIGDAAFTTTLNFLSDMFFSMNLAHYDSNLSREFKDHIGIALEIVGTPNLADYFSIFRFVDVQGLRRRARFHLTRLFSIFEKIIQHRIESKETKNDLLDVLLNLSQEIGSTLTINDITHLILDLFIAGTDTTSSVVEWAMTELLRDPDKLKKAQTELREFAGNELIIIEESDFSKLPYIQSVVKETLRLHPPAPFLIPHKAEAEFEIDVDDEKYLFRVPKNAQVLVNVWAIGRDPKVWEDPLVFMPERFFMKSEIDLKGRDFRLIPFGSGRRICPGMVLGDKMVHLLLTSLLLSFDWKLEEGINPQDIDLDEKFGLTLQKAIPLRAIPIPIKV
ncbi:cytochrome P450 76T24-like [Impatiens glandulifera]|uniref:cytochrome P450 76T24-like n=1 Tax=Impatiens glandulifera TaxID=253017 RepID=UPI001FB04C5E|nr:cytochrome P450 76T24-like [Impatiens glandulifera]